MNKDTFDYREMAKDKKETWPLKFNWLDVDVD